MGTLNDTHHGLDGNSALLLRQRRALHSISEVQRQFLEGEAPSQVFERLLATILEISDSNYGFIAEALVQNGAPYMRSHAITNISWNAETEPLYEAAKRDGLEFRNLNTLFGQVLTTHQVVIANEAPTDPRHGGIPHGHPPLNRFLGIPVFSGPELVGVVGVGNRLKPYSLDLVKELEPLTQTYGTLVVGLRRERARSQAERDLQRQTDALIESNAALKQAAQGRDEFLASISHELRTPLSSILAITEILREPSNEPLTQPHLRHIQVIEESSRHLLHLINDILEVARLQARLISVQIQPCSVSELVESSLRLLRTQARKRRILLSVEDPTADLLVLADPLRLKQILTNLLSNAIKFTPAGGEVSLTLLPTPETISFTVTDTGIGIPADKIPLLFQPFVQVETGLDRRYSGTGLGLAIVKRFTDLLNGNLSVESQPHLGSRFVVTLPRASPLSQLTQCTSGSSHPELPATEDSRPPIQVLLAEDNETNRLILASYLSNLGFHVAAVEDGHQILQQLESSQPDIVILDIQMPDLDGLEVARQIRKHPNPRVANLLIVALTALAMPGDRERCLAVGINNYVSKPFGLAELAKQLRLMCGR
jgi:signal transduction histidine kinase